MQAYIAITAHGAFHSKAFTDESALKDYMKTCGFTFSREQDAFEYVDEKGALLYPVRRIDIVFDYFKAP